MDKEPRKNRDTVPTQLPAQGAGILHVQDFPCNQEDDPERKVPRKGRKGVGGGVGVTRPDDITASLTAIS